MVSIEVIAFHHNYVSMGEVGIKMMTHLITLFNSRNLLRRVHVRFRKYDNLIIIF